MLLYYLGKDLSSSFPCTYAVACTDKIWISQTKQKPKLIPSYVCKVSCREFWHLFLRNRFRWCPDLVQTWSRYCGPDHLDQFRQPPPNVFMFNQKKGVQTKSSCQCFFFRKFQRECSLPKIEKFCWWYGKNRAPKISPHQVLISNPLNADQNDPKNWQNHGMISELSRKGIVNSGNVRISQIPWVMF